MLPQANSRFIEIAIMARTPQLGRVKTRLAHDVGEATALRVYTHLFSHTLRTVSAACETSRTVRPVLWFQGQTPSPVDLCGFDGQVLPQPSDDLGCNLDTALGRMGRDDVDGVLVIGSDHPTLAVTDLHQMLDLMTRHPVAVGPARDGGFWAFGAVIPTGSLFAKTDLRPGVGLASLCNQLQQMGLQAATGPELWDLDNLADLQEYETSLLQAQK